MFSNKTKRQILAAGASLAPMSVFAAVPAEVTAAVTGMATDGATVAAAVLVAIIGIVAIKFIRKGL